MRTALLTIACAAMLALAPSSQAAGKHEAPQPELTPLAGHKPGTPAKALNPFVKIDDEGYRFREIQHGGATTILSDLTPASKVSKLPEGFPVQFTVKLDYDESKYEWEGMGHVFALWGREHNLVNFGGNYDEATGTFTWSKEAVGDLPEGTYDFTTAFTDLANDDWIFLVYENVEITEGAEVVLRPDDATNRVVMEPLLPNGDKIKPHLVRVDDNGDLELIERGNVDFFQTSASFEYGEFLGGSTFYAYGYGRTEDASEFATVAMRFNDINGKYSVSLIAYSTVIDDDGIREYYSSIIPEHLTTGVYQTDLDNYTEISWEGAKGDLQQFDQLGADLGMIGFTLYNYGREMGGFQNGWTGYNYKERWFAPSSNSSIDRVTVAYQPYVHGFTQDLSDSPEDYHDYYYRGNWGQPVFYENGKWISYSTRRADYHVFFWTEDALGDSEIVWFPTNRRFDFDLSKTDLVLGNTVPIITAMPIIWHTDWVNPDNLTYIVSPKYCGRLGESNDGYLETTNYKVNYNGELVSEGTNYSREFLGPWWYGGQHELGVYDYELSQNHVLVDEAPASVVCKLHIDQTSGDQSAPTLQHLMTRNGDDFITDRFATPEGAFIEFAGGDFNPYERAFYEFLFAYEKVAAVKAEWAVQGSGEWHELEVAEVPDGFKWGWGDLYRAKLDGVTLPSESKWYDLRITLVDNAGNYQEQTLSPAFRIESVSGIEAVKGEGAKVYGVSGAIVVSGAARAEVYTIDGRKVADTAASRIPAAPGIYIVKTADRAVKVMVK